MSTVLLTTKIEDEAILTFSKRNISRKVNLHFVLDCQSKLNRKEGRKMTETLNPVSFLSKKLENASGFLPELAELGAAVLEVDSKDENANPSISKLFLPEISKESQENSQENGENDPERPRSSSFLQQMEESAEMLVAMSSSFSSQDLSSLLSPKPPRIPSDSPESSNIDDEKEEKMQEKTENSEESSGERITPQKRLFSSLISPEIPQENSEVSRNSEIFPPEKKVERNSEMPQTPLKISCLKHKKWKKRCPEDCPMRPSIAEDGTLVYPPVLPSTRGSQRGGRGSFRGNAGRRTPKKKGEEEEEDSEEEEYGEESSGSESGILSPSQRRTRRTPLRAVQNASSPSKRGRRGGRTTNNSMSSQMKEEDQISEEKEIYQENSQENSAKIQKKPKSSVSTSACSYHINLHARCPWNCPNRKSEQLEKENSENPEEIPKKSEKNSPKTPRTTRSSVQNSAQNSDFSKENQEISPKNEDGTSKASMFPLKKKILQMQMSPPLNSSEDFVEKEVEGEEEESKKETSYRRIPKSARKYLPSACDRHKALHARCPANCPDRLSKETPNGSVEVSEESGSDYEEVAHAEI